jgi:hypothetical protein
MHHSITEAAYDALPEWQRTMLSAQREKMIEFDCLIPDLMRAAANRKTLAKFLTLPNGDPFTHEPHSRHHNFDQILHYFSQAVDQVRAGDLDDASRWAGCVLHFIEDCGSPAHTIPGDNQHGLMKDLLPVPEAFRDRPLHSLIEGGQLKLDLAGYHPRLLGTTAPEAANNLVERINFAIRNARGQIIPILQGVFQNDQAAIDAGRRRAATVDAQVSADMLYTLLCIAKGKFDEGETAPLETVALTQLTPLEVMSQSYFPQFSYYSNPYFGYPTPDGILQDGVEKKPLELKVKENGSVAVKSFAHGLGVGTHTHLTYQFPTKVYDRFTCQLGLHASLGAEGHVVFHVYADGIAVFESNLTGDDTARTVDLPLDGVQELSIDVESAPPVKPATNYAVIAEPVLHKAKTPSTVLQKIP